MTQGASGPSPSPESGRDPDTRFRPAAYWFWSRLPSIETMRRQLADFREKGFGTILIQARISMPREIYLSDAFLDAYADAVAIMGELGLVAGLYDDYNWISGQAGGRTVEGADHLRESHLFFATSDKERGAISGIEATLAVSLGPEIAGWLYDGGRPRFADWEIVAATLHPKDGAAIDDIRDATKSVRIDRTSDDGCEFICDEELPPGYALTVFAAARCVTSRIVNYLMPEAGERFVGVGLEPFARRLGDLMPAPLAFLFFDQPAPGFYRWREIAGNLGNSLLFDRRFLADTARAQAVCLPRLLTVLLHDVGQRTAALRCGFYAAYAQRIHESFFIALRSFADRNGLRLTGHEILPHIGGFALNGGFSSIDPRVAPAVDFFGLDRMRDETAVDVNNFKAQIAPKLGDSVARAGGRSRCIAELYVTAERTTMRAAGQWELTPATLRAQMIRMHMLGARQVILHALFENDGRDGDPTLFSNPRFDFPPGYNFEPWWPHMRAISEETSRLSAFIEDAVPDPAVAILYPFETALAEGPRHSHAGEFGAWCEHLDTCGRDYLIVDETRLAEAEIDNGRLRIGGASIEAVVLPSVRVLRSSATAERLECFAASGGRVWSSGEIPTVSLDGALGPLAFVRRSTSDRETIATLVDTLRDDGPTIRAGGGLRVHVAGRDVDGFWRVLAFNETYAPIETEIRFAGSAQGEAWDLEQGACRSFSMSAGMSLAIEPHGLLAIRLRRAETVIHAQPSLRTATAGLEQALLLDSRWTLRIDGGEAPIAVDRGWQAEGHPGFSGIGIYETVFETNVEARLALELPGLACAAEIHLDGRPAGACFHPPFRVELGLVLPGQHVLAIHVANTAANRYYAGTPFAGTPWPDESGLTRPPRLVFLPDPSMEK